MYVGVIQMYMLFGILLKYRIAEKPTQNFTDKVMSN